MQIYQIATLAACPQNRSHPTNFRLPATFGQCLPTTCGCYAWGNPGLRKNSPWSPSWIVRMSLRSSALAGIFRWATFNGSLGLSTLNLGDCSNLRTRPGQRRRKASDCHKHHSHVAAVSRWNRPARPKTMQVLASAWPLRACDGPSPRRIQMCPRRPRNPVPQGSWASCRTTFGPKIPCQNELARRRAFALGR